MADLHPYGALFPRNNALAQETMLGFLAAGISVGFYLLYFLITRPIVAQVESQHLVYISPHFYIALVMVFYVAATCFSEFFSSHGFVKLFGGLALLSFIATYLFYTRALRQSPTCTA